MQHPWMKFYTRDWLDCKELRRCSPTARAMLADLMCLAHEGTPYGRLADSFGPLSHEFMASRCVVPIDDFRSAISDLCTFKRLEILPSGVMYIPRMIEDEAARLTKSEAGRKGGNPFVKQEVKQEVNQVVNQEVNQEVKVARACADSDSVCVFTTTENLQELLTKPLGARRPSASDLNGRTSQRFLELLERHPLKTHRDEACREYISVVTVDDESAVWACHDNYLASDQVARGIVMGLAKWIRENYRDGWEARWPAKVQPQQKLSTAERMELRRKKREADNGN